MNIATTIAIAIPAYRNAERLKRCLKSIKKLDEHWLNDVYVTDDSGDGQVAIALREEFPQVHWIINEHNEGFATSANKAVMSCPTEIALLLNDDIVLTEDPRTRLRELFSNSELFAVSLKSIDTEGKFREGAKKLVWRFGIAKILHNAGDQCELIEGVSQTSYAVGGHAAYKVSSFKSLSGFDVAFNPFYWEDVDLCARARKRGMCVLYASELSVLHSNDGAIKSTNSISAIRRATWRNRLLFSSRHASGLQRVLFRLGVLWHACHARMQNDRDKLLAITEFRNLQHTS